MSLFQFGFRRVVQGQTQSQENVEVAPDYMTTRSEVELDRVEYDEVSADLADPSSAKKKRARNNIQYAAEQRAAIGKYAPMRQPGR